MKKIIKKYGNSFVVIIDKEDMVIHKLKESDIIEFELKKVGKK